MKKEVIKAVRIMGVGTNELIMDFDLSIGFFNSIEWIPEENKIWLHMFTDGDFQLSVDWNDLDYDDRLDVYVVIRSILYN